MGWKYNHRLFVIIKGFEWVKVSIEQECGLGALIADEKADSYQFSETPEKAEKAGISIVTEAKHG